MKARASVAFALLAGATSVACVFWDMGDWSGRASAGDGGTGGDAIADGGAGADASVDGAPADAQPFCAAHDGAIFCADFDEDPSVSRGWSSSQTDPGTALEADETTWTSPPRSAKVTMAAQSGSCVYAYLAAPAPSSPVASTLALDVRVGEPDGGSLGPRDVPLSRQNFCAGAGCPSCPDVDHCSGNTICILILNATVTGTRVHEQVFRADGGPAIDVQHPFGGPKLTAGAWARVSIAADFSVSPATLHATLATSGGAPVTVLDDTLRAECSGAILKNVLVGLTCASDTIDDVVRFDDVLITAP